MFRVTRWLRMVYFMVAALLLAHPSGASAAAVLFVTDDAAWRQELMLDLKKKPGRHLGASGFQP